MAMGFGDGAELRSPMAVTVIAGLLASTLLKAGCRVVSGRAMASAQNPGKMLELIWRKGSPIISRTGEA
jgi:hypothetical protein